MLYNKANNFIFQNFKNPKQFGPSKYQNDQILTKTSLQNKQLFQILEILNYTQKRIRQGNWANEKWSKLQGINMYKSYDSILCCKDAMWVIPAWMWKGAGADDVESTCMRIRAEGNPTKRHRLCELIRKWPIAPAKHILFFVICTWEWPHSISNNFSMQWA